MTHLDARSGKVYRVHMVLVEIGSTDPLAAKSALINEADLPAGKYHFNTMVRGMWADVKRIVPQEEPA